MKLAKKRLFIKGKKMQDPYVLRVPMDKKEQSDFSRLYKKSGFKTMSEFVRFIIRHYAENLNKK